MIVDRSYVPLLDAFVNGGLGATEFSEAFIARFKRESGPLETEEFEALERVFGLCDGFTTDKELAATNPDYFVDEPTLRTAARAALRVLTGGDSFTMES